MHIAKNLSVSRRFFPVGIVAQVSNLLYRSASSLLTARTNLGPLFNFTLCRLEIGDTAGWKPALLWFRLCRPGDSAPYLIPPFMPLRTCVNQQPYRGRLAPSPTGLLHLGHARTFWMAQQRAIEVKGTLILRNEDLDRDRCKPQFVSAMFEDLNWFGFRWQEGPDCGGAFGPYSQSDRLAHYRTAFERLKAAGSITHASAPVRMCFGP